MRLASAGAPQAPGHASRTTTLRASGTTKRPAYSRASGTTSREGGQAL